MRDPANHVQALRDLRFALEVLDERSHFGLDEKSAGIVRNALMKQIRRTEEALSYPPSVKVEAEKLSAEEVLTA